MFKDLRARAKAIEKTLANVNETLTAANKTASLSTRSIPSYLYEHYEYKWSLFRHTSSSGNTPDDLTVVDATYASSQCGSFVSLVSTVVFDVVLMLCSMLCLVLHIVLSLLQTMFNWRANINLYSSTGGAVQTGTVFSRGYFTPRNI